MHKRILQTSNPKALKTALKIFKDVKMRKTKQGDAYVIEGPEQFAAVINKAVELFAID